MVARAALEDLGVGLQSLGFGRLWLRACFGALMCWHAEVWVRAFVVAQAVLAYACGV